MCNYGNFASKGYSSDNATTRLYIIISGALLMYLSVFLGLLPSTKKAEIRIQCNVSYYKVLQHSLRRFWICFPHTGSWDVFCWGRLLALQWCSRLLVKMVIDVEAGGYCFPHWGVACTFAPCCSMSSLSSHLDCACAFITVGPRLRNDRDRVT